MLQLSPALCNQMLQRGSLLSTIRITRKEIFSLFAGEVRSSITMSPGLHCHLQFYYEWSEDLNAETKFFFHSFISEGDNTLL